MYLPEILINQTFLWNKSSMWLCKQALYNQGASKAPGRWSHSEGKNKKASFSENPLWLVPSLGFGKMPPTTDGYEYRQQKRLCLYPKSWHIAPDSLTRLSKQLLCTVPTFRYFCQKCPSLGKNLPSGCSPMFEDLPLPFEQ